MGIGAAQVFGPVVTQRRVRIGLINDDPFDVAGKGGHHLAQPGPLQISQQRRIDLQVPGVVGFACLEDGAGRRLRVAAPLQDHPVEIWFPAPVKGVAFVNGAVVGRELDDAVGSRTQRGGVLRGAGPGGRAKAAAELLFADDGRARANEGVVWIRGRSVIYHPNR